MMPWQYHVVFLSRAVLYWMDAFVGSFIPFLVVFAGNCAIVAKMIANIFASRRLRAVATTDDDDSRKVTYM